MEFIAFTSQGLINAESTYTATMKDEANEGQFVEVRTRNICSRTSGLASAGRDEAEVNSAARNNASPYSRRAPDFTKSNLEALAAVAGLGYRWMGDHLGGRPSDPALLTGDGSPDWERVVATPGFAGALDQVIALAAGGRMTLLCAEALPDRCHRALVLAPALERRGWAVHHILPDGSAEAHQPSLFPPDPA